MSLKVEGVASCVAGGPRCQLVTIFVSLEIAS